MKRASQSQRVVASESISAGALVACNEEGEAVNADGREWPTHCSDVTWEMRGEACGEPAFTAGVGNLLWDPKMGAGHVVVAEVLCGENRDGRVANCGCAGWGTQPCPSIVLVCACGEDSSYRDHHDIVLARHRHP